MTNRIRCVLLVAITASYGLLALASQKATKVDEDFFKKWLEEDAVYIITKDELAAAKLLKTPEEKDSFIQSFWERRDPTPGTMNNEFRDEHYRRIAHANEKYTTATIGWRTDRGEMYIKLGQPDSIDSNLSAGSTTMRSGQNRMTVPFETWEYRNIAGVGPVKLTFVDRTMTGHFELSLNPEDKIAKFRNEDPALFRGDPNSTATMFETPDSVNWATRVEKYVAVRRPPEIRFKDLQALVNVRITYNALPFSIRVDTLRGPGDKAIVPITFEFDAAGISFSEGAEGQRSAVHVYGVVTDLTGRISYEFEDDVVLRDSLHFQRFVALDPGRYKVTAVAKDVGSGSAGIREQVIAISRPQKMLATSSLVLADILVPAAPSETVLDNFVISRYKVRPLVKPEASKDRSLGIYQEIYGFDLNPNTQQPEVSAVLQVFRKGVAAEILSSPVSAADLSTRYTDRILFAKNLDVSNLEAGEYVVRLTVKDEIKGESVVSEASVRLR